MEKLDRVTGRAGAAAALEASERAYRDFRDRNCVWVSASLSAGTGASDVKLEPACPHLALSRDRERRIRALPASTFGESTNPGTSHPSFHYHPQP